MRTSLAVLAFFPTLPARLSTAVLLILASMTCHAVQRVTTAAIGDLWFFPDREAPAEVVSLNDSRISAEVNARILSIPVSEGDLIPKDGVLAQLNPTDFELSLRGAKAKGDAFKAQIGLAKNQLRRVTTLRKTRSASEELVNQRQSELAALKAHLDEQDAAIRRARHDLERCTVRSPFRALVIERIASTGEMARTGSELVRILDLDALELQASVQATDIASLRATKEADFAALGQHYPVTLKTVVARIDPIRRSQEVRFSFRSDAALPGTTGRLIWRTTLPHLPPHLLVRRGKHLGLLLAEDGSARFMPLEDAQEGRPAAVTLPASTRIIVDGRFRVDDGDEIMVE